MAEFNTPDTRKEVVDKLVADVSIATNGDFLKVDLNKTLLASIGSRIFDVYRKSVQQFKQCFITTADDNYLIQHGNDLGLPLNLATQAEGNIVFKGVVGTVIPIGTQLQSANGITYQTQTDATIGLSQINPSSISRTGSIVTVSFSNSHNLASGFVIDSITGATPNDFNVTNQPIVVSNDNTFTFEKAGTAGSPTGTIVVQWKSAKVAIKSTTTGSNTNQIAGAKLITTNTIPNIDSNVFVDNNELSNGTDIEDYESYRDRLLFRTQKPVSHFNENEIITQAKKISGVTRVWVFSPSDTTSTISISSLTRNGNIATAVSSGHILTDGSFIKISGANQSDYNVKQRVLVDGNNIYFKVFNSPTTPATGIITASHSYVEPGQTKIFFTRDNDSSNIPSSLEVQKVKNELLKIKPSNMIEEDLIVLSPTPNPINFTFTSLEPNTQLMKDAITDSLKNYFRTQNNIGEIDKIDNIRAVIANSFDSTGAKPKYTLSSPSADIVNTFNKLSTLGTITF